MRWFPTMLLLLAACEAPPEAPPEPDSPRALEAYFEQVVADARAGKRDAVQAALEALLLTEAEVAALFGPDLGAQVWPGYRDTISADLREEAADAVIEQVAAGLTEVVSERIGPVYANATTPGSQRMLDAMVVRPAVYNVRLRPPGGSLGLRLEGLLYHQGRWRALFKAWQFLPTDEG